MIFQLARIVVLSVGMDLNTIDALLLRLDQSRREMVQNINDKIDKNHKDVVEKINSKFNELAARQRRSDEINRKTVNSINVVVSIVAVSVDQRICLFVLFF